MGNLDFAEKESSQIERKVKSKEQISQEQNSWLQNNAQNLSSQDIYSLINNYSLLNPKIQTETQNFKSRNSKALNAILAKEATPNEIKENPEITKKVNLYQNLTNNQKTSLKDIQNNLNNSTSLSLRAMDAVVGIFSDNNVFNTYASSFETTQLQAKQFLAKLGELDQKTLTPKQKEIFASLQKELNQILSLKLEKTGIVQMSVNEVKNIPQNLTYAANGVKGEVKGIYNGLESLTLFAIDTLEFAVKYPFSEKYRNDINTQIKEVYNFCKEHGVFGVASEVKIALSKELHRILTLPPEQQAEAIGNIGGNIIAMLITIKGINVVSSKLKIVNPKIVKANNLIAKGTEIGTDVARIERLTKILTTLKTQKTGLDTFYSVLNGVGETAFEKGLGATLKGFKNIYKGIGVTSDKLQFLENAIIEANKLKPENTQEKEIKELFLQELNREKGIIEKPKFDISKMTVEDIAKLNNSDRLEFSELLLGRKLQPKESKAILEAHNIGEANIEGKFSIGDLRKKYIILKNAGFNEEEIMKLFENKVCGKEKIPNLLKGISLYENPKYSFLEKYKEVLGDKLTLDNIVGEGTQAIILKHPTNEKLVIKIAKPGIVDDIMKEFHNHKLFYEKVKELKRQGLIDDKIKVPYVIGGEKSGYFFMEKVDGQSLYSKTLIDRFSNKLSKEDLDEIGKLEDKQVREFLKKKFNESDSYLDQIIEDYSGDFLADMLGDSYKYRRETGKIGGTLLDNSIKTLRENGISHNDLHPGNIMINRNGEIYMIDFGRIKEFNK